MGIRRHVFAVLPGLATILLSAMLCAALTVPPAFAQGWQWSRPPSAEDDARAFQWVRHSARNGLPWAQYQLGTLYEFGRGTDADPGQAFHWYQQAAAGGSPEAALRLGIFYRAGTGTEADPASALKWITAAADAELPEAQNLLGTLLATGDGVAPDPAQAMELWQKAAATGLPDAQYNLGRSLSGDASAQPGAIRWLLQAAWGFLDAGRLTEAAQAVDAVAALRADHPELTSLRAKLSPPEPSPPPAN